MAQITSINLTPGSVTPVHVTVGDQNGSPLTPSTIAWTLGENLGSFVTVTPDSTGFNFLALVGAPTVSDNATARYSINGAQANLFVYIGEPVTGLTFTSP